MKRRLAVDIPTPMHEALKKLSRKKWMTINQFVMRALIEHIIQEFGQAEMDKILKQMENPHELTTKIKAVTINS